MSRVRSTAVAFLVLGGAAGASHGLPPANEKWNRTISKHFEIIGNAGSDNARDVAIEFERFRAFMELGEKPAGEPVRMKVLLFRNEASFAPYKKTPKGEVRNFLGLFSETPAGVYIAMRSDLKRETFQVVYHEYTHYYLSKKPLFVPLWFHEGMAEYLSTFRSEDSRVILGEPVESHVLTLRLLPWMALGELFAVTPASTDYNEQERQNLFYAQSWGLFHYVRHARPELYKKFQALVEALNAGHEVVEAFPRAFGIDYRSFERGMEEYFRSGNPRYFEIDISGFEADESAQKQELSWAEVLYTLGAYLVDSSPWDTQAAIDHLGQAVALDPEHARAHAALATALERAGRRVDAREHFETACRLAQGDGMPFFRHGMSLLEPLMTKDPLVFDLPKQIPPEVREARQLLEQAIRSNPEGGEAYIGCGWTYLYASEDPVPGITLLSRARSLNPKRMEVVYYLVVLLLRQGEREAAKQLFQETSLFGDDSRFFEALLGLFPGIVEKPKRGEEPKVQMPRAPPTPPGGVRPDDPRLNRIEANWRRFDEAVKAYESGDYDRAAKLLNELSQVQDDETLEGSVERLGAQVREKQERLRQAKMYNAAAQKFREGEYQEAAALLEKLEAKPILDPSVALAAKDLAKKLQLVSPR